MIRFRYVRRDLKQSVVVSVPQSEKTEGLEMFAGQTIYADNEDGARFWRSFMGVGTCSS